MNNSKTLIFESYDGYNLEGTFLKAINEKAAVLFVHGITSDRDELGFHSDYANFLSENGISSLRFDYRYHGKYESSLKNLSLCGILNDIDSAFLTLKKQVDTNLNTYFLIATSFGGGISAFWAEFNQVDEVKKIILNAPVINYEEDVVRGSLSNDEKLSRNAKNQLNKYDFIDSGDIEFGRALINELNYINGIKALQALNDKIVIFHGDCDDDVPLESSKKYISNDDNLIIIENVGHGFGVDGDEDLDFPETKVIHNQIYNQALKIMATYYE